MSRIVWSEAAEGAEVIPILLIAGVPAIFYPEGVTVTGLNIVDGMGSPDFPPEWWPGNTFANWTTYGKPWLSLRGDGVSVSERAQPTQSTMLDVSEVTVYLADIPDGSEEYGATALFSNSNNLKSTYLTATVSASATTLNVVSTTGASSGTAYLGQEAITYSGKTSTTFTGCTRGAFGSTPTTHYYDEAAGTGLGNPVVLNGSDEVIGRPATLWLAEVTAGVITKLSLEHFGNVGTGAALADGSDGEGWVLHVDHAIKRLGQKINSRAISVQGFVHAGSLGARTTLQLPYAGDFCPLFVSAADSSGVVALAILTGDAAAPDRGGWHPTRESFVADFAAAGQASFGAAGANFSASLDTSGALRISVAGFGAARNLRLFKPWANPIDDSATSVLAWSFSPTTAMPKAYVPIFVNSPVYVTQGDYTSVPDVPAADPAWSAYNAEVYYCLVMEDSNNRASRKVARITGKATSGGAYYLTCTALDAPAVTVPGYYAGLFPAPTDRGGPRRAGFVVNEPTTARLGLYTKADNWVRALQFAMQTLGADFASVIGAIDFEDMARVTSVYPSALRGAREYVLDLDATPLEILANEAVLNGFALTMRNGKVSVARIAEFAVTEPADYSLTSADLKRGDATPGYEKGSDGIVNTFTVNVPEQALTINVVDATSRGRYGTRGGMEATFPRGTIGGSADASRLYVQIFAQAATILGPHRYPYEHVTVKLPLNKHDAQVGDLILIESLWRIPNRSGGRGITNHIAQVVARELSLYREQTDGWVAYTLRLNPSNVQGYAPTGLVEASGISGANVTLDATTFGPGGFAGPEYVNGGASTFLVGDFVRLVEIDTTTPTTSTQHTVTAVSGATITLNPAPNATFAGLAASALKVMLIFDDWSVVSARPGQAKFAYLSDASYSLDGGSTAGRLFAA